VTAMKLTIRRIENARLTKYCQMDGCPTDS
jgi:hypothetical protein